VDIEATTALAVGATKSVTKRSSSPRAIRSSTWATGRVITASTRARVGRSLVEHKVNARVSGFLGFVGSITEEWAVWKAT